MTDYSTGINERIMEAGANLHIFVCNGKRSKPHIHNFLELAYVVKGSAVHTFNETEEQIISEGDFFIIDYRTAHGYSSVDGGDLEIINCLFQPRLIDNSLAYCRDFQTLLGHYLIQIDGGMSCPVMSDRILHDNSGRVLSILRQMLDEYGSENSGAAEMLRIKLIEILIVSARLLNAEKKDDIITDIISRLRENYNTAPTLGEIADEISYSLPYLSKLFKETCGISFKEYVQKLRIDEACRLLANTNEKIWSISKSVGYSDTDFFCRIFKKALGKSPSAFRKEIQALKN